MKSVVFIFILFLGFNGWGQSYRSTHTIHFPQQIQEDIQRTLTFSKEYVHIKSLVGNQNVDNQVWHIHKHWEEEENEVYHLISLDETHSIRMYIKKENPQYIEVHQPIEDEGIQRLHLILENLQ